MSEASTSTLIRVLLKQRHPAELKGDTIWDFKFSY